MDKDILKSVCIDYQHLSPSIRDTLLINAKKIEGSCTKEEGYIILVRSIKKIVDNHISPSTSHIIFDLLLDAVVMKPHVGQIIDGVVTLVHQQGIFVNMYTMNVVIPESKLEKYNPVDNSFEHKNKKIFAKSTVSVKINVIRYEDNKFKCVGELS